MYDWKIIPNFKVLKQSVLILERAHGETLCQLLPPYPCEQPWWQCECLPTTAEVSSGPREATCHILWSPSTVEVCLMASSGLMRTVTRWERILLTTACVLFTRSKSALFCCPVERQLLQKGLALSPRSSTVCSFTQSLNIYLNLSPRIFKRVKAPLNTKQLRGVCKNNTRWTSKYFYVWGIATKWTLISNYLFSNWRTNTCPILLLKITNNHIKMTC